MTKSQPTNHSQIPADGVATGSVQADQSAIAIGHNATAQVTILPKAEAQTRRDLDILLKNIENAWIKGVLESSLHHTMMLELGLEARPDTVDHPWDMVIERPEQPKQPLPAGTKIIDLFDETRLLLILGEPGSGKTITLLELARDLIARLKADPDFIQPVPVIFNLSTWSNKRQPLVEWLIEEFRSKYQTPRRLSQEWLETRRILPLLDGLDEVQQLHRNECVVAINQFVEDYGGQGAVVCSRVQDYVHLDERLHFNRALYLQPLTIEQVKAVLAQASDKLVGLSDALQKDQTLQTLAQSPLMLNVMLMAYQDMSDLPDISANAVETRRNHLFDTYIKRMFQRRGQAGLYTDYETVPHLVWLAKQMREHHHTIFLIEQMQPSWIATHQWLWAYIFSSRISVGLICGVSVGLIFGLLRGILFGVLIGLSTGLIDGLRLNGKFKHLRAKRYWQWNTLAVGGIVGVLFFLSYSGAFSRVFQSGLGLIGWLFEDTGRRITFGISGYIISSVIVAMGAGYLFGRRESQQQITTDIQTVEALSWSKPKAVKNAWWGALFGILTGLLAGILSAITGGFKFSICPTGLILFNGIGGSLVGGGIYALIFGLMCAIIGAVFGGLQGQVIETKLRSNQGLHLTWYNALSLGAVIGITFGLVGGIIPGLLSAVIYSQCLDFWSGLREGLIFGVGIGLSFGLSASLLAAIWYGASELIQHLVLRLVLRYSVSVPWNLTHFLNYCVDRIFLQKVGGGYRFIHRSLLEHFAQMDTVQTGMKPDTESPSQICNEIHK